MISIEIGNLICEFDLVSWLIEIFPWSLQDRVLVGVLLQLHINSSPVDTFFDQEIDETLLKKSNLSHENENLLLWLRWPRMKIFLQISKKILLMDVSIYELVLVVLVLISHSSTLLYNKIFFENFSWWEIRRNRLKMFCLYECGAGINRSRKWWWNCLMLVDLCRAHRHRSLPDRLSTIEHFLKGISVNSPIEVVFECLLEFCVVKQLSIYMWSCHCWQRCDKKTDRRTVLLWCSYIWKVKKVLYADFSMWKHWMSQLSICRFFFFWLDTLTFVEQRFQWEE